MNKRSYAMLSMSIALMACKFDGQGSAPAPSGSASAVANFSVEPVQVVERMLDTTTELPAELAPYDQVDVYPKVAGFVREVKVDRGSAVKKGDLLIALEAPELVSQVAEAQAKVAGDKSTVDRLEAAQHQVQGAVAEHDIELAHSSLQASAAKLESLRTLEGYLTLNAPFDGVITERDVSPGALVGPPAGGKGTPLLKMELVSKLRLTVAVPESQTSAIKLGDTFEFKVRAWPGRKFTGIVSRPARSIDVKTRTMPIELDVDNADGALSPGMFVTVAWHTKRATPTLFVPESAIVQGTDKTFVVRIKDDAADPVKVERGATMQGLVEVFGDLKAGDVVAKRGSEELKPGTPLTLREAAAGSASPSAAPAPSASGKK